MEIAIFPEHIGILDVNVEKIIFMEMISQCPYFVPYYLPRIQDIHANQSRYALIHGIDRHGSRTYLEEFNHTQDFGGLREPPQEDGIGRLLGFQYLGGLLDEAIYDSFRERGAVRDGSGGNARLPVLLGIGVGQPISQSFPPEENNESVFLSRPDGNLYPFYLFNAIPQKVAEGPVFFSWDPSRPPIDDNPVFIHRSEIAPGGEIALGKLHSNSRGLQNPPADLVFHGIVSKQGQMRGTASGSNSGEDGISKPADRFRG